MKKDKKYFDFVLKYPEMVDAIYTKKKGKLIEYVYGDILKKDLKDKLEDNLYPVISLDRMMCILSLYKTDNNVFKRFKDIIKDYNDMKN